MKDRLQKAYDIASRATKKAQERQKHYYDLKVRGNNIEVGDRVMVKIVAFDGKHKLSNRWEEEPYVVLDIPNPDIPVYVVQKENGEGRKRTLHRNLLLPVGTLNSSFKETVIRKPPIPAPRRKVTSNLRENGVSPELESDEKDDSSDDELLTRKVMKLPRPTTSQNLLMDDSDDKQDEEGADVECSTEQEEQPHSTGIEDGSPEPVTEPEELVRVRRSTRQRKEPKWMKEGEFVVNMVCRAMMNAVLENK